MGGFCRATKNPAGHVRKEHRNMVKIRLMRTGTQKAPAYRLVVVDSRRKRTGGYIESLGSINPHADNHQLDTERARHWLSTGAQPTASAIQLLEKAGVEVSAKATAKRLKDYKSRVGATA
jgi:small subunit ribosomal protein S16